MSDPRVESVTIRNNNKNCSRTNNDKTVEQAIYISETVEQPIHINETLNITNATPDLNNNTTGFSIWIYLMLIYNRERES